MRDVPPNACATGVSAPDGWTGVRHTIISLVDCIEPSPTILITIPAMQGEYAIEMH
jgi:hypothetical protein